MGASVLQEPVTFVTMRDSTLKTVATGSSEALTHTHRTPRRHISKNRNMNHSDSLHVLFNFNNSDPVPLYSERNDYFWPVFFLANGYGPVVRQTTTWSLRTTIISCIMSPGRPSLACVAHRLICTYIQIFKVTLCKVRSHETQSFELLCVDDQRDVQFLQIFLFHDFLLYMFRTNLVHHQEHGIIYCITQYNRYNRACESRLACTIVPIVPNCVIQYIIPCSWWTSNSFETCRAKNRGIKKFIRIVHLVGHLHIAIWCTVHTVQRQVSIIISTT